MDLGEDALHPEWLSTHYLNTVVVEGHKHGGERAFKEVRSEFPTELTAETVGTSARRR